jgi:hypothetical protein
MIRFINKDLSIQMAALMLAMGIYGTVFDNALIFHFI